MVRDSVENLRLLYDIKKLEYDNASEEMINRDCLKLEHDVEQLFEIIYLLEFMIGDCNERNFRKLI